MIFLKWNRLNRNCSGCVYHGEIIYIASESPWKTVYAIFFPFWVAASYGTTIYSTNTYRIFSVNSFSYSFFPLPSLRALRPEPRVLRSSEDFQSHSLPFLRQLSPVLKHLPPHMWHVPPHLWHLPLFLKPSHILWSSSTPSEVLTTAFETLSTSSDALPHPLRSSAHFLKLLAKHYPRSTVVPLSQGAKRGWYGNQMV